MGLNDFGQPGLITHTLKKLNDGDDPGGVVAMEEYPNNKMVEHPFDLGDFGAISTEAVKFATMFSRETVVDHLLIAISALSLTGSEVLNFKLYKAAASTFVGSLTSSEEIGTFTVAASDEPLINVNFNGTDEGERTFQAGEALFIGLAGVDGAGDADLGQVRGILMGRNFRNG
mgnify:CR=1 FL=1